MFDGVGWAAAEIVVFMVVATLVGFAVGWIFGRWLQSRTIAEGFEAELTAQEELARKAEHRLTESNKSLDKLQLELKGGHERIGELEAQLESLQAELDAAPAEADQAAAGQLNEDLEACRAERDELTARVAELEAQLAERAAEEAPQPAEASPPEDSGPTKEEGLARIAEIAARTAGDGPAADDDLKEVHGIGPKLERTLKGLGITSFRQIANFEAEDIAYVTAALDAFKGRIERDDWMSSAAELHLEKYNEPA